ncbi:hypothetical protein Tco_0060728 [Tanacetum coccineum]
MKEVINTHRLSSTNLDNLAELIREANIPGLRNNLEAIQNTLNAHRDELDESYRSLSWNVGPRLTKIKLDQQSIQSDISSLKTNTANIKAMITEMFFLKGRPRKKKKSLLTLRGSKKTWSLRSLKSKAQVTKLTAKPIITESTPIIEASGSSQITLRVDKGKGIATEDDPSQPKLMKALKEVIIDYNGPVLIDWEIDG